MSDPWTDLQFWAITHEASRILVVCHPDQVDHVRAAVDAHHVGAITDVQGRWWIPRGQMYAIDVEASEAQWNEWAQQARNRKRPRGEPATMATKRSITVQAADPKAGMTLAELRDLVEQAGPDSDTARTRVKATMTIGGRLKALTIEIEG